MAAGPSEAITLERALRMASKTGFPGRQVHLDFHTGPSVPDVGRDFDAREFARTMQAAHVDSVTVFAKCHHGHLYYDTKRPERHPGLRRGLDLLGEQIEALHGAGIRAPIYISVQCDEYAANTHPEWVARKPDGGQVKWGDSVFKPAWQILDMSTDYQEYLAEQTAEVLRTFKPVDGLFFDMCWDQPSTTGPFMAQMVRAGLNPEDAGDRQTYAHRLAIKYLRRFSQMVKAQGRNASCFFNSRSLGNLAEEVGYLTQVEIEALPTGGWGYMYFPKNVRFARTFDRPYLGMTARFHKSWADFGGLKPYAALEYETSQMMAHGARCSIGDQMHPRGTLDRGAYDLIGKIYARVQAREPWLKDAKPLTQIGLFQATSGDTYGMTGIDEGATRLLTQLKHQFDVVHPTGPWAKYDLLVLPDAVAIDAALAKKLTAYVKKGGAVLASGYSGVSLDATESVWPMLGIKPLGKSPYSTTYLRFDKELAVGVPESDHVMYEPGLRVKALKGTRSLGQVIEPYFERAWDHFCSHQQTPGATATANPIATLGKRVGYIPFPIFSAFAKHGNYPYRLLVKNLLDLLLPDPLLRMDAPTSTEATVLTQGGRTIVHVLQYCPERRAKDLDIVEDIVPLHDVPLSIRLARAPKKAYMAPECEPLGFAWTGTHADLVIPVVHGHAMVVLE